LVLHTFIQLKKVLTLALKLEKKLGRVRNSEIGYQSRIIDIDVIAFDEEVITSDKLQVPHPLMQNRKFVLMPFLDLETNWKHPVLNKTVGELLELTPDKSSCTVVSFRQSARDMSFEQFNYVALRVILAQENNFSN
jgi:7,8-dihydro-6-hydroxymethylpterin-pyrophosphokinase